MTYLTKFIYIAILVALIFNNINAQSPWVQNKSEGYGQLSYIVIPEYNEFFGSSEKIIAPRSFSESIIQLYGEYGILNSTTLIADIGYKLLKAGDAIDTTSITQAGNFSNLGNINIALKQKLIDKNFALAFQLAAAIPTSQYDEATGLRTGYDALTLTPTLNFGKGFNKSYFYTYAGVGLRNNDYSNIFTGGAEFGYKFFDRLWAMVFADVVRSFKDGDRIDLAENLESGFYLNDQEWVTARIKLLFEIKENIGLNFSSTILGLEGNRVPASPSISIGFFVKW